MRANLLLGLALVMLASPAHAEATKISEPSDLALFALGVIGLIIGRRGGRRKP
jgi:hypothetical protein